MSTDDPRKIFLSHKTCDKGFVIDFKDTLDLLGYETWLDKDDMPAGTVLNRGLLKGMKESCAVVFFITTSFKDEGYLETEINYAIQQKEEKGDRFAIITLQFIGDDGQKAPISDPLKPYVWATPRTDLEALREIIRALPVAPGNVKWRDEITEAATESGMVSPSVELSDEAKTILREAVSDGGDGVIRNIRTLRGQFIRVNGKLLPPGPDPRAAARWVGGIEDLQRYVYIRDIGDEGRYGEVFEVTREGYAAADEMSDA